MDSKLIQENKRLIKEVGELKEENRQLKHLVEYYQSNMKQHIEPNLNKEAMIQAKMNERIQLFSNLFKGRKDIYAYRWVSKDGDSGYAPAKNSKSNSYYPLTKTVIEGHLTGDLTLGIYPLLRNNTCWFLAIDFDKNDWKEDVKHFIGTCKQLRIPAYMERSRSGNGCHVWFFFTEPISATLAREFGTLLLTYTIDRRNKRELKSFDRMFPNQDELTKGKFGNLIALPLQGQSRKEHNSVFIDENFNPFKDQWDYLAKVNRISKKEIQSLINTSSNKNMFIQEGPVVAPLSNKINIICTNGIYINTNEISQHILEQVVGLAKFSNPDYYRAEKKRHSTKRIPRVIDCSERDGNYLILPRGCLEDLKELLKKASIDYTLVNNTYLGSRVDVNFTGKLSFHQEESLGSMTKFNTGILEAAMGFGKTVIGAALIAERKVNTLVIVHRKQLMNQWREQLGAFLDIQPEQIGLIGGGKNSRQGKIDIAMIQSIKDEKKLKDLNKYGQIIVDECHHFSAYTFEKVLKRFDSAYVHGLTATSKRKDGHEAIMRMQLGRTRYKISAKDLSKLRPFKHILIPRYTSFKSKLIDKGNTNEGLYKELILDEKRNTMIFNDVLKELEQGAAPIILTERVDHVKILADKFAGFTKNLFILTGNLSDREKASRLDALNKLPDEEERLIIATGKYIGEGFDNPRLDTLFLIFPFSWKGTLQQYVGRLHRVHEQKSVVKVYDYIDRKEGIFENMYENRKKGYKALGYVMPKEGQEKLTEQMKLF